MGSGASPLAMTTRSSKNTVAHDAGLSRTKRRPGRQRGPPGGTVGRLSEVLLIKFGVGRT